MVDETTDNEEVLLWTLQAAADALSVHPKTVSRLAKSGQLSAICIGRSIRIEKQSVYHFIESHRLYNHPSVESAVRDPTGERICRIEIPKNAKMEVPTKVRTTRSASQQMEDDYNALLGRKP